MAVDENGFIILSRNLCDHWVWLKTPVSYGQAWVDLLLLANYKSKKIPYKGGTIEGKPGTVYRSIRWFAERWGWSRAKVRRFINLLESDGMVNANVTTNQTTITIVNYEKYQHRPKEKKTTNVTTNGQRVDSERTTNGQRVDTYNKDNKDNKVNKGTKNIEPSGSDSETENEPDWQAIWDSLPDATPGIEGAEE